MPSPRIAPLDPPYPPGVGEQLAAFMPPGMEPLKLFRTVARSPRLLAKLFGANLLDRGPVDKRDRELVIHRTCARCGSEYEWGVHVVAFGRRYGIDEQLLAATVIASAADPVWPARERLLIRLVDELHETATVSDELWAALAAEWTTEQLLELVMLVGLYHTVAFLTNAAGVELEEMGARFPAAP